MPAMQTVRTLDASRGGGPHRPKVAGWHRSSKQLPGDLPSLSRTQNGAGIASGARRCLMQDNLDICTMTTVMACSIHCRVGSSEKKGSPSAGSGDVHCRVGSSENYVHAILEGALVHCRVGSSEITDIGSFSREKVHCRVGSSEIRGEAEGGCVSVHCRVGSSCNARGIHRTRCWVGGSNPCDAIAKDRSLPQFFSRAK